MFSGWIRISDEILMIRILFIRHYSFSITSDFESNSIQFLKWMTFILFWLCVQITHENNDEAITILYSSVWISLTNSSITSIIQPELALQWAHWIVRNLDTAVTNANCKFIHSFSHGYKYFFSISHYIHCFTMQMNAWRLLSLSAAANFGFLWLHMTTNVTHLTGFMHCMLSVIRTM